MKKIILVIFLCLPIFLSAHKVESYYFLDFKNDTFKINLSSNSIFITFSESNCHNCYLQINDLINTIDFKSKGFEIYILASIDKKLVYDIAYKRRICNSAIDFFPMINKVYFITEENKEMYKIFDKKINLLEMPTIFIMKDSNIYIYEESKIFNNSGLDPKFIKTLQQL